MWLRQATIEEHEKEMSALVEDEGRIAKDMEARLSEVKEVREGGGGAVGMGQQSKYQWPLWETAFFVLDECRTARDSAVAGPVGGGEPGERAGVGEVHGAGGALRKVRRRGGTCRGRQALALCFVSSPTASARLRGVLMALCLPVCVGSTGDGRAAGAGHAVRELPGIGRQRGPPHLHRHAGAARGILRLQGRDGLGGSRAPTAWLTAEWV